MVPEHGENLHAWGGCFMKRKAMFPSSVYLVIGSSVVALLASLGLSMLFPGWRWHHEPLHSTIVALGGLTAIAMAIVLLQSTQQQTRKKFYPVAGGFLAMGLLEVFHALSTPGSGFVLLRSLAGLVGGLGFALVWLSPSESQGRRPRVSSLWWLAVGMIAFGLWTLGFPEQLPVMIHQGEFTQTAIVIKTIAGILFFAGAMYFLSDYRRTHKFEDGMFACLALLFGLSEFMFTYSSVWDWQWWFWHWIRLAAYLLVLGYVVRDYLGALTELQVSLAQTRQAEESVRRSELQLRALLEERKRLVQDLHDGAIQSIFTVGLSLERCQRLILTRPREAVNQIDNLIAELKVVIRDLRSYLSGKEPDPQHELPLDEAIASLVGTMNDSGPFNVRMHVDPEAARQLTREESTHVLYILKEAMSNSLRHAQAQSGTVSLSMKESVVRLEIEDDGCGFDIGQGQKQGYGLKNMAARARQLGARFELVSERKKGTHIIFDLHKQERGVAAST